MGKGKRTRFERQELRRKFGTDVLPLDQQKSLDKTIKSLELWNEIVDDLSDYSKQSVIVALSGQTPGFGVNRVLRLLARVQNGGTREMNRREAAHFVRRAVSVWNPDIVQLLADGTLNQWSVSSLMAEQLPIQRDHRQSLHRIASVFLDDTCDYLGPNAWTNRLGCSLGSFVLGTMGLAQSFREHNGTLDWERYLGTGTDGLNSALRASRAQLAMLVSELKESSRESPTWYDQWPLLHKPIIDLENGIVIAPVAEYVDLAWSPAGLYIRLIREDRGSRVRTTLIGHRFGTYLLEYARSSLPGGWSVIDLDDGRDSADREKIADIAIVAPDDEFAIVIDAKSSLSRASAQAGRDPDVAKLLKIYQHAFDQIDSTRKRFGTDPLVQHVPADIPVFALAVTLDLHPTSVAGNRTYVGLSLNYGDLGLYAESAVGTPSRVWDAEQFEILMDTAMNLPPSDVRRVLDRSFASEVFAKPVNDAIASSDLDLGHSPVSPVVSDGLLRLVRDLPEDMALLARELTNLD